MAEDTSALSLVDETARKRFERAWLDGAPAPIEQVLPAAPGPVYLATLQELVAIEMELSRKSARQRSASDATPAQPPRVEDYLARFPALNQPAIVLRLLKEERRARLGNGERPSPDEYRSRFPALVPTGREVDVTLPLLPPAAQEKPTIPGYEVHERLGEGGMGIVYRARHLALNRMVALKIMSRQAGAQGDERQRFKIEAEAVARLQHPHIVQVHEIGEERGQPYFALELVEGGNLAEKIAGTPQPSGPSAQLVEVLARAMHHAHERGIVHRDLKPANVLLAPPHPPTPSPRTGEGERMRSGEAAPSPRLAPLFPFLGEGVGGRGEGFALPKIADFGLAKRLDEIGHTQTGAIMGTPSYMAPEQASGGARHVGPAADVYALGAILYECLTGRPPFKATTTVETIMQVLADDPVPPRQFQSKVPVDLETICLKCLEKEPARRYASALELADDLRSFREGKPIRARPVGTAGRLWRWARRNPALAVVAGLAAVALVGVTVVSVAFAVQQANAANAKTAAAQRLEEEQKQTWDALDKAECLAASLALDRGLTFCEQGDVRLGLLWLARALRMAPADDEDLRWAVRANLALWSRQIAPLRASLAPEGVVLAAAFSPDGKVALTSRGTSAQFWDTATGRPLGARIEHAIQGRIVAVAFSPDGRTAITGSWARTAMLWDVPTARPRFTLAHEGRLKAVAFRPDGRTVLTGGEDQPVFLWDVGTGKALRNVPLGKGSVLAFSPDGKLALLARGPTAQVWDLNTGKPLGGPLIHAGLIDPDAVPFAPEDGLEAFKAGALGTADVVAATFGPDSRTVLTAGQDRTVRHWEAVSGKALGRPLVHQGPVLAVAFSPDGRAILTGGADGAARLWDGRTGEPLGTPLPHPDQVFAVAVGPGGRSLLTGGADRVGRLWSADLGPLLGVRVPSAIAGWLPALSADGRAVLTPDSDGTARLWNARTGKPVGGPLAHANGVSAAAFSPDGQTVLTCGGEGTARRWEAATGKPFGAALAAPHADLVFAIAFGPDGKVVLTGGRDGTGRLWRADTGKLVAPILKHGGHVEMVAFAPDGKTAVTGSPVPPGMSRRAEPKLRLWDALTGRAIAPLEQEGTRMAVAFRPDGKAFLTAGALGARLWDAPTGRLLGGPFAHHGRALAVAFGPAGKWVLTGGGEASRGGEARFWAPDTGQPSGPPLVHQAPVWAVALSPNGKVALTGSEDQTARLWATAAARPLGPAVRHRGKVGSVAFSADGRTVLTASDDRVARLTAVPPPVHDDAARVLLWVEALTGMEMGAEDVVRKLDDRAWAARRQLLKEAGGPP